MQPRRIAKWARDLALDKKAEEPVILDIGKISSVANYFVIMHGNSNRQVKAIGEHIIEEFKKKDMLPWHVEGNGVGDTEWFLIDFGSVIVHIFYRDKREFYGLERLWGDAPRIQ